MVVTVEPRRDDPRRTPPGAEPGPVSRRAVVRVAAGGATLAVLGGIYVFDEAQTRAAAGQTRPDGKPRLPPGQRVIRRLRPMGGIEGDPSRARLRLRIHGEVDRPQVLTYADLLALGPIEAAADVHCVTGWSVLGARWTGIPLRRLAALARVRPGARHVIFEAAGGYTANVRVHQALDDTSMVTWKLDGRPLPRAHGAPLRALVPDLYFWKSAKWLTGIRFTRRDAPGYWEIRGYHNNADPWREERYA